MALIEESMRGKSETPWYAFVYLLREGDLSHMSVLYYYNIYHAQIYEDWR